MFLLIHPLLLLTIVGVANSNDWSLRSMSISVSTTGVPPFQQTYDGEINKQIFSPHRTQFLGPLNCVEGNNITFGIELLQEPAVDVPVTVAIINKQMEATPTYVSTFIPTILSPGSTFVATKKDWINKIYLISITILDDTNVNPNKAEELEVQITSSVMSTRLTVTLYVIENDVLECGVGYKHKPGHPALIDTFGHKSPDCTPCESGTYNQVPGVDECTNCPADSYSSKIALSTNLGCQRCPVPTVTYSIAGSDHSEDCFCPIGFYPTFLNINNFVQKKRYQNEEYHLNTDVNVSLTTTVASCETCPPGGLCALPGSQYINETEYINISRTNNETNPFDTNNWLSSKEGYWKIPWEKDYKKKMIKCFSRQMCHKNDICRNHSSGIMCSTCDSGFYKSNDKCIQCTENEIYLRIGILLGVLLVVTIIFKLLQPIMKKYRGAWRDLLRVVKIQLDFWQVTSSMPSVLPVEFPQVWVDLVARLSFVVSCSS